MDAIDLMIEEHRNIQRVLRVIRKVCVQIVNGEQVDYGIFDQIIDFVRNYADRHHHSKEENIVFEEMSEQLGQAIAAGPIYGMFAEHDLGRLFIYNLENAVREVRQGNREARVDVIGNAIAYTDLLNRHIDKEDSTIYSLARKRLSENSLAEINRRCMEVERVAQEHNIPANYLIMIEELERRTGNIFDRPFDIRQRPPLSHL